MEAVDKNVPLPVRDIDKPFAMRSKIFSRSPDAARWLRPSRARQVKVGEEIEIVGFRPTQKKVVTGVRCSASCWMKAWRATTLDCCCAARKKKMWSAGKWFASRARSRRTTKFKAEAYVLTKEEGGRHTPFFTGYRPQFYFRTTDVTGDVKLPQAWKW